MNDERLCPRCGVKLTDENFVPGGRFCPECGYEFSMFDKGITAPTQKAETVSTFDTAYADYETTYVGKHSTNLEEVSGGENILAGIVGAFIFSLGGGVLTFLIYQTGYISFWSGLVTFFLANLGYEIFSKNKLSKVSAFVACIVSVVVMFVAMYICYAYDLYVVFKEYGITIFDAISSLPEFFDEPEVMEGFMHDLLLAEVFTIIGCISEACSNAKKRKKRAQV